MSPNFLRFIDRILGHEGGYVFNPRDPGGETKFGISKRSYPHLNIKDLTRDQAVQIYFEDFWLKIDGDHFATGISFQLLDSAVNSGIFQSIRFLQRAAGVADDGHYGPISDKAVKTLSDSDLIMRFLAERLEFMTKQSTFDEFGKGWSRRIAQNLRYGAEDNVE